MKLILRNPNTSPSYLNSIHFHTPSPLIPKQHTPNLLQSPTCKFIKPATMPRSFQTTYSEGILSGLPTFPAHDGKKYTAIVTGSNGISGSEIVNALAASPERWSTIYSMSRKPPKSDNPHVKPIAADFLSSTPEELAALFKKEGVKADYIFFTSYLQPAAPEGTGLWTNTDDLDKVNGTFLPRLNPTSSLEFGLND